MEVSFCRPMNSEFWTDFQLDLLNNGGNQRFMLFMKQYKLEKEKDLSTKYDSLPCDFYRRNLESIVTEGKELEEQLHGETQIEQKQVAETNDDDWVFIAEKAEEAEVDLNVSEIARFDPTFKQKNDIKAKALAKFQAFKGFGI